MGLKPTKAMKRAVKLSEADARWSDRVFRPPVSDPPDPDCVNSGELDPRDKEYQERLKPLIVRSGLYDSRYDKKPPDNPVRPMPEKRRKVEAPPFGFQEPAEIPNGKMTIRKAIGMLTKHTDQPETWTAATLAVDTQLDKKQVDTVLRYFHLLELDPCGQHGQGKQKGVTVAQASVFRPSTGLLPPETEDKKLRHMAEKTQVNP